MRILIGGMSTLPRVAGRAKGSRPRTLGTCSLLAHGDTSHVTSGLCHQVRESQCYKPWESAKIPTNMYKLLLINKESY